jgi:ATP-binding cassette subfamily F protein uup
LLKLLLGQLSPRTGRVQHGSNLRIAFFDQLREQLDEHRTVQENVGDGADFVVLNGARKHIIGYLQDFLFTAERSRTEVRFLSGGERNRVLLARLFAGPANLLVLDEPTNDLDTETLEMLEARLVEFPGTVLLVSHDREFLNHVVGSCIVFEDDRIHEYAGGYDDWLQQRPPPATGQPGTSAVRRSRQPRSPTGLPRRLKYAEQQELKKLPARIDDLESRIGELHVAMAQPSFYQQESRVIAGKQAELKTLEADLSQAWERWEELERLNQAS